MKPFTVSILASLMILSFPSKVFAQAESSGGTRGGDDLKAYIISGGELDILVCPAQESKEFSCATVDCSFAEKTNSLDLLCVLLTGSGVN